MRRRRERVPAAPERSAGYLEYRPARSLPIFRVKNAKRFGMALQRSAHGRPRRFSKVEIHRRQPRARHRRDPRARAAGRRTTRAIKLREPAGRRQPPADCALRRARERRPRSSTEPDHAAGGASSRRRTRRRVRRAVVVLCPGLLGQPRSDARSSPIISSRHGALHRCRRGVARTRAPACSPRRPSPSSAIAVAQAEARRLAGDQEFASRLAALTPTGETAVPTASWCTDAFSTGSGPRHDRTAALRRPRGPRHGPGNFAAASSSPMCRPCR